MKRADFIKSSLGFMGLATIAPSNFFKKSVAFQAENGAIELLRGKVAIFTKSGGTMGLLMDDSQTVVIDSQYPDNAKEAIQQLKDKGLTDKVLLCNTHHHGDHTGGNDLFKEIGARLLAHKAVPDLMKKQAESRNRPLAAQPTELFASSFKLQLGSQHLHAQHFGPAHTGGDAVYHFEEANIAHTGDLVFNGVYPFIDANGGGSIKSWIQVLKQIEAHFDQDTLFIFGHGTSVTGSLKDITAKKNYLSSLMDSAEKAVKGGVNKEDYSKDPSINFERTEMWKGAKAMNMERAWEEASKS